jgi:3',5'-cyclic AMP phosphodiesterase CpdA
MKIVWMSDPHFVQDGLVLDHDPRIRLQTAVAHINEHHADASMCVISGDMVNRGTETDYEGVAMTLSELAMPFLPMMGNHDTRELFRRFLPFPKEAMEEFIQYQVRTPEAHVICLDTHKIGSDAGEFCETRRTWLLERLHGAKDMPTLLFMHHPPMPLGLPMQDTEGMENGQAFIDLVSNSGCIKYMFIGHVHRPIFGTVKGIPFSTMRSVLYQAPSPKPEWNWDTFKPSEEAPNIGIVQLEAGSVTLQYEQFCGYQIGVVAS